jgi:hypothetical protein
MYPVGSRRREGKSGSVTSILAGPDSSVADPGCLSRIQIFSIPDPGARVEMTPGSWIRIKELSILI